MMTFLPYPDFEKSAKALDYRRLGKQRLECKQIINLLENKSQVNKKGYYSHPAVRMWEGYLSALQMYANIMITEWKTRGYNNTMPLYTIKDFNEVPWWLGNEDFHRAMRSRLIEKLPAFYLEQFGEVDKGFNDSKYFWPVNESKTFRII